MHLDKMNPAAPGRAQAGLGYQQSSAAREPDHTTASVIINRLQRRFCITEMHAATIAALAGLGPQAVRS